MEILRVENLSKVYGKGQTQVTALDNVSFNVEKGEFVAIVGASGSGKSTLLHLIGGVDRPTSGKVFIDGKDIYNFNDDGLAIFRRRQVGLIYQFYNLIPILNVEENITLPLSLDNREVNKNKLDELIKTLGLENRRNHLPNELSGGQQQRTSIGRAMITNPAIILADEPTGNLDSKSSDEIVELLKKSNRDYKQTIIMITHDLGVVASMCEKIAVMYAGHIVEYGTADEIFYNPSHEYTKGLIKSIPKLNAEKIERLVPIEGQPVDLLNPPAGCPFAPRCSECMKICLNKMPPKTELSDTHYSYCWLLQKEALKGEENCE